MGCPTCVPGDVEVRGKGDASCSLCGGGFVRFGAVVQRLTTAGVDGAGMQMIIHQQGKRDEPCPTCGAPFIAFPIGSELFRACTACSAIWLDDGALDRATAKRIEAMPGGPFVAPAQPSTPSATAPPTSTRPMGSAREAPKRAPAAFVAAPRRETARPPEPRSQLKAVIATNGGSNAKRVWATLFAAFVVAAGVRSFTFGPSPTAVGPGGTVQFWDAPVAAAEAVTLSAASATRVRSEKGVTRLEVVQLSVPEERIEATLAELYGERLKLAAAKSAGVVREGEGVLKSAGEPPRLGRVRVYLSGLDAWVLVASAEDDGSFASSRVAEEFLSSLRAR